MRQPNFTDRSAKELVILLMLHNHSPQLQSARALSILRTKHEKLNDPGLIPSILKRNVLKALCTNILSEVL